MNRPSLRGSVRRRIRARLPARGQARFRASPGSRARIGGRRTRPHPPRPPRSRAPPDDPARRCASPVPAHRVEGVWRAPGCSPGGWRRARDWPSPGRAAADHGDGRTRHPHHRRRGSQDVPANEREFRPVSAAGAAPVAGGAGARTGIAPILIARGATSEVGSKTGHNRRAPLPFR